jgi:transcriptional regulator with XRE-family HTH domain
MAIKRTLKDNILDIKLMTSAELCRTFGVRLKLQRLSKKIKQQDLADMAGVSVGTIKNIELKGQSSLESLIKVVIALDLANELSELFKMRLSSISQMEQVDKIMNAKVQKRVR